MSDYLKLRKCFFLVELKPLFLESFQGSGTISEQKTSHVTDGRVF